MTRIPLSAAEALGRAMARATCTWSTSTVPRPGAPANLEHLRRIAPSSGVPVQFGGGLRSPRCGRRRLRRRRRAGDPWHGGLHRLRLLDRRARAVARASARVGGRARRPGRHRRLDARRSMSAPLRSSAAWPSRGARELVYTNVDRDGMLEGPDLEEVARRRRGRATAASIYSGGIGALADLAGACRSGRRRAWRA